jgi:hypothetical protein
VAFLLPPISIDSSSISRIPACKIIVNCLIIIDFHHFLPQITVLIPPEDDSYQEKLKKRIRQEGRRAKQRKALVEKEKPTNATQLSVFF